MFILPNGFGIILKIPDNIIGMIFLAAFILFIRLDFHSFSFELGIFLGLSLILLSFFFLSFYRLVFCFCFCDIYIFLTMYGNVLNVNGTTYSILLDVFGLRLLDNPVSIHPWHRHCSECKS